MPPPAAMQTSFQGTAQAFVASLTNEPILILAALVTVYIVLGVLYESYIHPVTILSTLPSAGVGALLALMFCRQELTVVAIIGIVLLIGIVKKNAIMMIDFALEAERKEGKPPDEAIYQASLLRFRPIMMTTMAALLGAVPLGIRPWRRLRATAAARHHHHRRALLSQLLTLYTTPVIYLFFDQLAAGLALRAVVEDSEHTPHLDANRRRAMNESLLAFYSSAGRDDAADSSGCTCGSSCIPPASGFTAATSRFSDHLSLRVVARRKSGNHGIVRRHAARAAIWTDCRRYRDDVREFARTRRASRCNSISIGTSMPPRVMWRQPLMRLGRIFRPTCPRTRRTAK